jgi:oligosaccharide translocation protein RFT1
MAELRTNVRVRAEGFGITGKTLITFILLVYDTRRGEGEGALALIAFAGGQLAYGVIVLLTYLAFYGVGFLQPKTFRTKYVRGNQFVSILMVPVAEATMRLILNCYDSH